MIKQVIAVMIILVGIGISLFSSYRVGYEAGFNAGKTISYEPVYMSPTMSPAYTSYDTYYQERYERYLQHSDYLTKLLLEAQNSRETSADQVAGLKAQLGEANFTISWYEAMTGVKMQVKSEPAK